MGTMRRGMPSWVFILCCLLSAAAAAQENYEIQVYASPTVPKGYTMFETHTNFVFEGSKNFSGSVRPTNHALHETIEITHGWNSWFETGFYAFFSASEPFGFNWVGDHIRPRVRAPDSWHWPVGASLSIEMGYTRPEYSADTWTMEIRPIVDKDLGRWYLAFNPTMERSFHGPSVSSGLVFSPNAKASFQTTKKIALGVEYYGSLGPLSGFDPIAQQQQQIFPVIDLDFGEDWEFNFGVGVGLTGATDHLIAKMIVGRRFSWGRKK
jgi:hypothetical protein